MAAQSALADSSEVPYKYLHHQKDFCGRRIKGFVDGEENRHLGMMAFGTADRLRA